MFDRQSCTPVFQALPSQEVDLACAPSTVPTSLRVLVVDDNEDAASTMADALALLGNVVVVARTGEEALEIARGFKPDVAVLDLGLPAMDGYELAEQLGRMRELAGIRLVAATGFGQERDQRRSREAGFDAHLVKPIELSTLVAALRS